MENLIKELHTTKFHLWPEGRLEVYDHRLATKLNRFYRRYDNGEYVFKPGEEAIYFVSQVEYRDILSKFLGPKSTLGRQARAKHGRVAS